MGLKAPGQASGSPAVKLDRNPLLHIGPPVSRTHPEMPAATAAIEEAAGEPVIQAAPEGQADFTPAEAPAAPVAPVTLPARTDALPGIRVRQKVNPPAAAEDFEKRYNYHIPAALHAGFSEYCIISGKGGPTTLRSWFEEWRKRPNWAQVQSFDAARQVGATGQISIVLKKSELTELKLECHRMKVDISSIFAFIISRRLPQDFQ